jgi:hypothetical protein
LTMHFSLIILSALEFHSILTGGEQAMATAIG